MIQFSSFAKVGAILSFTLNFIPAIWLLSRADLRQEPIAGILALALLSSAIFMGLLLWFLGERLGSRS